MDPWFLIPHIMTTTSLLPSHQSKINTAQPSSVRLPLPQTGTGFNSRTTRPVQSAFAFTDPEGYTDRYLRLQCRAERGTQISTTRSNKRLVGDLTSWEPVQGPEMFGWYDDPWSWVLPTGDFSGTNAIGLSFVFLAYFLHPAVEKAYQRVRAYRGWRAIETSQTVEVTTYPLVSEIFGGRGRWDAARIVAVLLAGFSLASWGLELKMELAHIDDSVTDLFLRPPPVWKQGDDWIVIQPDKLDIVEGEVHNMDGSFSVGTAKARYEVNNRTNIIDGKVRVALWDTDLEDIQTHLFYDDGEGIGRVKNTNCFSNETSEDIYVCGERERWGTVVDCKNGPQRVHGEIISTSHVVKLASDAGDVYFIVEESSTYPSFLYSVWKAENETDGSATLHHVFHISSSVRLAEAVVTEIVHADGDSKGPTGGRSFALLRVFSENHPSYDIAPEDRASPFGEHPTGERPVGIRLSTIETIEKGIKLNTTAFLCAVWLMFLGLVGIAWSLLLRSSIKMDIYDRDELIRAVTLAGSVNGAEHSSKMRIFVRKEEGGNLSVFISDDELHPIYCVQRCRKQHKVIAIDDPMPIPPSHYPCESGCSLVPNRPRTVWLEGVRVGKGRAYPGRRGNYRYPTSIALIASPVPSHAGSVAGTPVHQLASLTDVPPNIRKFPSVNPALFDSVRPLGNYDENDDDVEMGTAGSSEEQQAKPSIKTGSPSPRQSESHETEALDLRELRLLSEKTATLHDRSLMPSHVECKVRSSFRTRERSEPPQIDQGEETKNDLKGYNNAEVADTEGDVLHDSDNEVV